MEGYTYNLKANECMFINSGIIHSTRCTYQNTSILLQVPLSFLNKYIPDFKIAILTLRLMPMTITIKKFK